MDTELLKTFLEVARTRHFGKAARNLYVSQSTISARVHQLEEQLGASLFVRARNNIQLTPVGLRLLPHAEAMLTSWSRVRQEVINEENITDVVVVGAVPSLWDIALNEWLVRIYDLMPSLSIIGEVKQVDSLVSSVQTGMLDIGFLFDPVQISGLVLETVSSIPLVLVSTRKNMDMETILQEDYVHVDWGAAFSVKYDKALQRQPASRIRVDQGRLALEFLRNHAGSAYLPKPMIVDELKKGKLNIVKGASVIDRTMYAVYAENNSKPELIRDLLLQLK